MTTPTKRTPPIDRSNHVAVLLLVPFFRALGEHAGCRGPKDPINTRILHSGSKAQYKRDTRNHVCSTSSLCTMYHIKPYTICSIPDTIYHKLPYSLYTIPYTMFHVGIHMFALSFVALSSSFARCPLTLARQGRAEPGFTWRWREASALMRVLCWMVQEASHVLWGYF